MWDFVESESKPLASFCRKMTAIDLESQWVKNKICFNFSEKSVKVFVLSLYLNWQCVELGNITLSVKVYFKFVQELKSKETYLKLFVLTQRCQRRIVFLYHNYWLIDLWPVGIHICTSSFLKKRLGSNAGWFCTKTGRIWNGNLYLTKK